MMMPAMKTAPQSSIGLISGINTAQLIDQLMATLGERDKRSRAILSHLRRQIQEDQLTFQEARKAIVELEGALEKVTAPANRVGTYLGSPAEGIASVSIGGSDYYSQIDPRVDAAELSVGTRVLVNEAYAVVGDLGYTPSGPVVRVGDLLEGGRLRISQAPPRWLSMAMSSTSTTSAPATAETALRTAASWSSPVVNRRRR
jgi:proteasome-associated ATPase